MEGRADSQHHDDVVDDVTDSDEDTVTIGERDDDEDAATVVNDDLDAPIDEQAPPGPGQRASLVKVAVTVNGKSQLLALDQRLPLDEVCRGLCNDCDIRWREARYSLALVARAGGGQKYVTELNRGEVLKNGAELVLTYSPGVFADLILDKLNGKANNPDERPWALQRLSELCADPNFVAALLERPGVVDLLLGLLVNDRKGQRLRHKELLWTLRALLSLVRQGVLSGDEADLVAVMKRLSEYIRAEQSVEPTLLEMSLRLLAAVSAQPWAVSAAQHLSVLDVVPMLWYTEKPGVQTHGLELMNVLAAREARLGPGSPEAKMQATKTLTSPQVCATIVQNVLCSPVRSNMARQLYNLQRLVLQPLQESIDTPVDPSLVAPDRPPVPPPRHTRRRRKSAASSLLHSHSWCEGDAEHAERVVLPGDRRSLDDAPYKLLPPTRTDGLLRPASAEVEADGRSLSPASTTYTQGSASRDSMGSVTSLASDDSAWCRPSHRGSHSTLWSELPEDAMEPEVPPSRLGQECLDYLRDYHPGLAVRALEEEQALYSSLNNTAERLVRLLGAELLLCRDPDGTPSSAKSNLYQPLLFSRDVPFFHELFCRGLNLLAKTRREMRAKTQRDQDKVFRVVRRQFREALRAQVSSWDQLDSWLSALPYSAVAALWERERVSGVLSAPGVLQLRERSRAKLYQLVRQQRLDTLRAGARFRRPGKLSRTGVGKGVKRGPVWVWLAPGDAALLYADCPEGKDDGDLSGEPPLSLPLSSVTAVLTGKKCTHIRTSRSQKQGVDLALSLTLDPNDSEVPSLDLIAKDAPTLLAWADGLNMLLGKDKEPYSPTVKRDLDELADMEIRLQLMELDGVTLPSEPPPVPPPPPDYDFATD